MRVGIAFFFLILSSCGQPQHIVPESFLRVYGQSTAQWPLDYRSLYDNILQKKCASCHSQFGDAEKILFTYPEIVADAKLWKKPGARSRVVRALVRRDKNRMPPAPRAPLSDEEIDFISRWIDAGLPEFADTELEGL